MIDRDPAVRRSVTTHTDQLTVDCRIMFLLVEAPEMNNAADPG
jgi:hypothetical protein